MALEAKSQTKKQCNIRKENNFSHFVQKIVITITKDLESYSVENSLVNLLIPYGSLKYAHPFSEIPFKRKKPSAACFECNLDLILTFKKYVHLKIIIK